MSHQRVWGEADMLSQHREYAVNTMIIIQSIKGYEKD